MIVVNSAYVGESGCSEFSDVCESKGRAHSSLLMIAVCFSGCGMSGSSLLRPRKFEDSSALMLRNPLHGFSETNWNVELNHVCHLRTPCPTLAERLQLCNWLDFCETLYRGSCKTLWEARQSYF